MLWQLRKVNSHSLEEFRSLVGAMAFGSQNCSNHSKGTPKFFPLLRGCPKSRRRMPLSSRLCQGPLDMLAYVHVRPKSAGRLQSGFVWKRVAMLPGMFVFSFGSLLFLAQRPVGFAANMSRAAGFCGYVRDCIVLRRRSRGHAAETGRDEEGLLDYQPGD